MEFDKILLLYLVSVALAIFEIQIEGDSGWAEKLPCWRAKPGSIGQKIYGIFFAGKPLDGFHLSELALLALMFHLPVTWAPQWNAALEFELIAYLIMTIACWDFLWFILNPAFGWKRFKPEYIWWHKHWWGPFPTDYYGGVIYSAVLAVLSAYLGGRFKPALETIGLNLGALVLLTAVTSLASEIYRRSRKSGGASS